ncbi:MAG: hypothetical protein IKD45_02145, partial [Clostridia bacterium]|nr:hypothetical protein [Clostridia bacterium]
MGMCFIESSSLCLHFGEAKTSLVPLAQTSLRSNFTFARAKTSLAKRSISTKGGMTRDMHTVCARYAPRAREGSFASRVKFLLSQIFALAKVKLLRSEVCAKGT